MGGKDGRSVSLGGLVTAGLFRGLNASLKESLGLDARAGVFIPNGNNDRSHRGATLLALRKADAGAADVMLEGGGH
jgi:hypothetical protein